MRSSSFQISTFTEPTATWAENAELPLQLEKTFRRKSISAGDLKAKNQFWNSAGSNPTGEKLLHLFDVNQFEMSAPQGPTHYSPTGNGDLLDIVVLQNIRTSDVIVSIFWTQITYQ
jgi:hypothetical protein